MHIRVRATASKGPHLNPSLLVLVYSACVPKQYLTTKQVQKVVAFVFELFCDHHSGTLW